MVYLRMTLIGLALIFFLVVAAPLQAVALRRGWPMRLRIPVLFGRTLAALLRIKLETRGIAAPDGPRLLAANHVSWIDILALCSVQPVCFLAKKEIAGWPVISAFARLQETVFVDRARRRSIPRANSAIAERMLAGRRALLFPEGTTGDGVTLRRFHSSHFAAARDLLTKAHDVETVFIQPVAIRYSSPSAVWCGDAYLLPHVWSVLKGEPIRCELAFGEPLVFGRETDRKAVARDIAAAITEMLAGIGPAAEDVADPSAPARDALAAPTAA